MLGHWFHCLHTCMSHSAFHLTPRRAATGLGPVRQELRGEHKLLRREVVVRHADGMINAAHYMRQ